MSARVYAPAIVLAFWAVLSATGVSLAVVMLIVIGWTVLGMASELGARYKDRL